MPVSASPSSLSRLCPLFKRFGPFAALSSPLVCAASLATLPPLPPCRHDAASHCDPQGWRGHLAGYDRWPSLLLQRFVSAWLIAATALCLAVCAAGKGQLIS